MAVSMPRRPVTGSLAVLLLVGCATGAGGPEPAASVRQAASVTVADVEIVARTGVWRGWPSDLARTVTPVRVTVLNQGLVPLRVSYDDFALVMPDGRRLPSVFPADVRGVVHQPPPTPLPSAGFALDTQGYRTPPDWVDRGPKPGALGDPIARVSEQFALPTPDVLDGALPEGVLPPGGRFSGFVYFDRLPPHAGAVDVSARLVDALSGEPIAQAIVPLRFP
jgi:hypothetical protein